MTAEEYLGMAVPQRFMAKVLGLTQGRISQLLDEGILIRDEESGQAMLHESIKSYYLSKNTTGSGVNFWTEKALHERAKRQLAELKVRQREGELYEAAEVERELGELMTELRNKLVGMGHKLAKRLEGLPAAGICDIIDGEIEEIMEEISRDVEEAEYKTNNPADNGTGDAD